MLNSGCLETFKNWKLFGNLFCGYYFWYKKDYCLKFDFLEIDLIKGNKATTIFFFFNNKFKSYFIVL